MNIKSTLVALAGVTLISATAAVAIHRNNQNSDLVPGAQKFSVRGVVREIEAQEKMVRIAHEEIPGYMAAMTMPFSVNDAKVLRNVRRGDDVEFELIVTESDSWISRIATITPADVTTSASQLREPSASGDIGNERLETGESIPDFALTDQRGEPFQFHNLKGKAVLLTFIYTRCPIPNFCPLMSKNFADLQQRLEKEFPGQFHLLSVSIDPEFDTPQILNGYAERFSYDPETWTYAAGTLEQIQHVGGLFGLTREPENGLISHDLRTALIDQEGRLVHVWKGNVWTPFEVMRMVQELFPAKSNRYVK